MLKNRLDVVCSKYAWLHVGALGICWCLSLAAASHAFADDFKIENSVYVGESQEQTQKPTTRSITYFTANAVYDMMKEPAEVTIFEKSVERFVLIDVNRRVRTELTLQDITLFVQKLQQLAAKNPDPLIKFAAEPTFREGFDAAKNELTLSSQWVNYRLILTPEPNQQAVEQYREYCDWQAKLNAMLSPGSLPPFGRIQVNSSIAQHQSIASQVFLTIASPKNGQPPTIFHSDHNLVRPLTTADQERIAHLRAALGDFKLVKFEEYRKVEKH
jgi:hypothetical protein